MNRRFVEALAQFFSEQSLVDALDSEAIDAALEQPFLGYIADKLRPRGLLIFDSERFYQDSDVAKLVGELASLTQGEWMIENLKSQLLRDDELGKVEFDSLGEHVVWEFDQYGDYVSDDFWAKVKDFCESKLSGRFHRLASMSQELYVLYLAGSNSTEFERLVETFQPTGDEIVQFVATVDDWHDKGLTGWILIRNALRQYDLGNINAVGQGGRAPLVVAVEKAMAGSSGAKELAYALVELGADPAMLSGDLREFWQQGMK
jgi:hypothetical protein